MANNAQKTPVARSLNIFAEKKANDAIQLLGKALPASVVSAQGSIVTVKFEIKTNFTIPNVTCPVASSRYEFLPLQQGDPGIVVPSDARISAIAGLGGTIADLSLPANLSSLVFMPIANASWPAPTDPNKYEIWGPDGTIIRNGDKSSSITVDDTGAAIKVPLGKSLSISNLPASAAGLPSGSLWRNGAQVMVVP